MSTPQVDAIEEVLAEIGLRSEIKYGNMCDKGWAQLAALLAQIEEQQKRIESECERGDSLEAMVDRMAEKAAENQIKWAAECERRMEARYKKRIEELEKENEKVSGELWLCENTLREMLGEY